MASPTKIRVYDPKSCADKQCLTTQFQIICRQDGSSCMNGVHQKVWTRPTILTRYFVVILTLFSPRYICANTRTGALEKTDFSQISVWKRAVCFLPVKLSRFAEKNKVCQKYHNFIRGTLTNWVGGLSDQ